MEDIINDFNVITDLYDRQQSIMKKIVFNSNEFYQLIALIATTPRLFTSNVIEEIKAAIDQKAESIHLLFLAYMNNDIYYNLTSICVFKNMNINFINIVTKK